MKTLKQWEKNEALEWHEFIKPMERIDELLFFHILCGYTASRFDTGYTKIDDADQSFGQASECKTEIEGVRYYATVGSIEGKYYYLGHLPAFKKAK